MKFQESYHWLGSDKFADMTINSRYQSLKSQLVKFKMVYNFDGELPKFCKTHKLEGMVHTIDVLAAQTPAPVKRSSTDLESSSEQAKPLKIAKLQSEMDRDKEAGTPIDEEFGKEKLLTHDWLEYVEVDGVHVLRCKHCSQIGVNKSTIKEKRFILGFKTKEEYKRRPSSFADHRKSGVHQNSKRTSSIKLALAVGNVKVE